MYLYIELRMPRDAWRGLSEAERHQLVVEVGSGAARLLRLIRDEGHPAVSKGCSYVAVWELPEGEELEALDQLLNASWHEYFTEINARGTADPPTEVLGASGWKLSSNGSGV